jgi:sterol desaturase/sphingolipid hydroxylase (fatty acid hydroxylase superfamily)
VKDWAQTYATVYVGSITVMALLEWLSPRRPMSHAPGWRWIGNFGVSIVGAALVRLLLPLAGAGWAVFAREHSLGLFNQMRAPGWLAFGVTILVLDATAWIQHYLLHRVPVLWRVHRTHHSDLDVDFSTGVRFHPFESLYTTLILSGAVLLLGAPPVAVLASQVISTGLDFLEHANLGIPAWLDRRLRLVVVTPDMHRIHHSQDLREGNANFSTTFSWWDRLFGTYVEQPAAGHERLAFGIEEMAEPKHLELHWMLAQPFLPTKPSPNAVRSVVE